MKILIVIDGFFPAKKYGGPPVSVDNFCSLMREHECFIVTRNHDMGEKEEYRGILAGVWTKRNNCKVCYLSDSDYCKTKFEMIVNEINPDVLYLQGLFQSCILPCLSLAKKYRIKVLLAPRGELCKGAFKKKYKKLPYITYLRAFGLLQNVRYQSTSREETEAISRYLSVPKDRIFYLTNIPSVPSQEYLFDEKLSGRANIVFLSRIHPKKNLLKAIQFLKNVKGNVKFDIYGSLEEREYWEECQQEINRLPSNIKVQYCGLISHDNVHVTFSKYDAFLFPTFSENYGHVIIEALVVGCPVIISDQTPWNDVQESEAGWVSSLDDEDSFVSAIQTIVDVDSNKYKVNARRYAQNKLDLVAMKQQYQLVLDRINQN